MNDSDFLIKNALLIDGSGKAGQKCDLAITHDSISLLGPHLKVSAKRTISADHLICAPGFIDMHGHTDHYLLIDPPSSSKIEQGVTTEVFGNCGYSPFFLKGPFIKHFQTEMDLYGLRKHWADLESFSSLVEKAKPAINWLTLVGHGTLRTACMGFDNRPPTSDELKLMKRELENAMDQGALGLSCGLIYTPGCFARIQELISLGKILTKKGGLYSTHMRSEGEHLIESIQEALKITQKSHIPLQISHLKTAGEKNWFKITRVFEVLEEAISQGQDVTWDRYPYTASYTSLDTYLPRSLFDGGDLAAVKKLSKITTRSKYIKLLNSSPESSYQTMTANIQGESNKRWNGKSLRECTEESGKSIGEFIIDLLIEEKMQVNAIFFSMSEANMDRILLHSNAMIGSDASARTRNGKTFLPFVHPRTYGTFPRFLRRYSLDHHYLSIEKAIYKMTGLPAQKLGLKKRGLIRKGNFADLVLFDPLKFKDSSTFQDSTKEPEGLEFVFVNGKIAYERGRLTFGSAGRFLGRGQS